MTLPTVVIGVGNEFRQDDGVGPAVIGLLRAHGAPGLLTISDGEPTGLLEAWSGAGTVIVVDALGCGSGTPGRVHRVVLRPAHGAPDLRGADAGTSSHGLGIVHALRLAEALDRAPPRLVLFAVEAAATGFGPGLSPAVEAAATRVAGCVLAELRG